jgi:hypothetical protein
MYLYCTDVLETIFNINYARFAIIVKTERYSDCNVVFVPEALLINNVSESPKELEIKYDRDQYWAFYYECNTHNAYRWDYGRLRGVEVGNTSNKTLSEEQKILIFERYYRFLQSIEQELYEKDCIESCIRDNPLDKVIAGLTNIYG